MNSLVDIVFLTDIVRLPKDTLKEICTDLNLENTGVSFELSTRVWEHIRQNHANRSHSLEKCKGKLLAGQTSITWYQLESEASLRGFTNTLQEACGFNPFERIRIPSIEDLTTEPVLIAGAKGPEEGQYYLRFMYKSGVKREYYGTEVSISPKSEITTVYVDEKTGLIEVRADAKKSDKVATAFARLINQQVTLNQVVAPFSVDIEKIADNLGGELIDVTSKPEFILEDFTPEHAKAVVDILAALDNYLKTMDINQLEADLNEANEAFNDEHLTVPFAALILNGMEKVGLGGERELRGLSLYDSLNPYLQHQGGFIRFKYPEGQVEKLYTIRVGITTKTIYFNTPATEDVIDFVRKSVII
jgi:hypothetical protein